MNRYIYGILSFGLLAVVFGMQSRIELARGAFSPTVNSVSISTTTPSGGHDSTITLNEGTTKALYTRGTITDSDGCSDLSLFSLKSTLYRSSVSGAEACTTDDTNCYRVVYASGACTISGCDIGNESTINYECDFNIQYYADSTDSDGYPSDNWVGFVTVSDSSYATGTNSNTTEINSLAALTVSSPINYGVLAIGVTSTQDSLAIATNTGNVKIDVNLSGTDMYCTRGSVSSTYQRYSKTAGQNFDDMTQLATTSQLVHLNLAKKMNSYQDSTTSMYFKMIVPSGEGAKGGSCSGTDTFSAVVDTPPS